MAKKKKYEKKLHLTGHLFGWLAPVPVYDMKKQNSLGGLEAPPKPQQHNNNNNANIQQYRIKYKKMLQKGLDSGKIKRCLQHYEQ